LVWPRGELAVLGLTAALFLAAGARVASRPARLPSTNSRPADVPMWTPVRSALPHIAEDVLMTAVFMDPFRPDRSGPEERYRLAELNAAHSAEARARFEHSIPGYRLYGTAVSEQVRLAVIDGFPGRRGMRVYQLGDTIDVFHLTTIAGDSVVLTGTDTTIVVRIQRPWMK
jgi:hypothetical protein